MSPDAAASFDEEAHRSIEPVSPKRHCGRSPDGRVLRFRTPGSASSKSTIQPPRQTNAAVWGTLESHSIM